MNNLRTSLWSILLISMSMLVFVSCGDDDEDGGGGPAALTLSALTASGPSLNTGADTIVDLNGATSATDVPPAAVITAIFSSALDASSVTSSSVTITAGSESGVLNLDVDGNTLTITPDGEMPRGTDLTLTLGGGIKSADGGALAELTRTFRTAGRAEADPPQSGTQNLYLKLDGDASDETGNYASGTEIAVTYDTDRFGAQNSCAYFDGDASIIEIADAAGMMNNTTDFTVSFWYKTESDGHVNDNGDPAGMFVFGLGAFMGIQYEIFADFSGSKFAISYENDTTNYSEDMWFPVDATDNTNGGWQGWDFAKSLSQTEMEAVIKDTWVHVIYSYNAAERTGTLWFNGEKMKSFDFDLWPDGDPKRGTNGVTYRGSEPDVVDELALGFIHSRAGTMWDSEPWGGYDFATANHFKGWLDDFRVLHAAYSDDDASALYNAERP